MEGNYYNRKLGILTDTRDGSNEMEANFQSEMGFLRVWPLRGWRRERRESVRV